MVILIIVDPKVIVGFQLACCVSGLPWSQRNFYQHTFVVVAAVLYISRNIEFLFTVFAIQVSRLPGFGFAQSSTLLLSEELLFKNCSCLIRDVANCVDQ